MEPLKIHNSFFPTILSQHSELIKKQEAMTHRLGIITYRPNPPSGFQA